MKNFQANYKVFGMVKSGNTNKGYLVDFNMFPSGHKTVQLTRKHLTTLSKDEEEINDPTINSNNFLEIDNEDDDEVEVEADGAAITRTTAKKKKKIDRMKASFKNFALLDK
jgi:hypothetical protein